MDRVLSLIITIFLVLASSCIHSQGYSRNDFPQDFAFGSGLSAYQWEGAVHEDGRKPSIWDTFVHTFREENGDTACDGYHKYKVLFFYVPSPNQMFLFVTCNDFCFGPCAGRVQLMVETGLNALRFSISWSRLIPKGRGPINPKGLHFYKSFINELVTNGIEPHVTLFHYDLPQTLEDEYGGWRSRRVITDFTAYVDVCFREFGNKVKFWNTINEANVFTIGGYDNGLSAPARCSIPNTNCSSGNSSTEPYIVAHNLLLAHASASRLYKQKYKDTQGGSVGFNMFAIGFMPSTNSKDDEIATQRARDFWLGWMLSPLIYGDYPDSMKLTVGTRLPVFTEEESDKVQDSADFLGINQYLAATVTKMKPSPSGNPDFYSDMGVSPTFLGNLSANEYAVAPWAMEEILECIKQNYGNLPVYIHENGTPTKRDSLLELKDTPRIEFLDAYIGVVLKAVQNGSDTRGYFVWSFMDLFEILSGYESSFGMYYVNFSDPDLKRSPKLSAQWYTAFLKGNNTFLGSQGITQLRSNFSSSS